MHWRGQTEFTLCPIRIIFHPINAERMKQQKNQLKYSKQI